MSRRRTESKDAAQEMKRLLSGQVDAIYNKAREEALSASGEALSASMDGDAMNSGIDYHADEHRISERREGLERRQAAPHSSSRHDRQDLPERRSGERRQGMGRRMG